MDVRDDVGGEHLHLLEVAAHRVEEDEVGTAVGHRLQALDAVLRRTRHRDRGDVAQPEEPVQPVQRVGDLAAGLVAVLPDRQVDPLGDREAGRVPTRLVERGPDDGGVLDELRRGRRSRAEEPVTEANGPPERIRVTAGQPDRRVR